MHYGKIDEFENSSPLIYFLEILIMLLLAPFGRSAAKITDLKEAKVELKSSSSTKQFQILLVLMRKDFWYVLVLHFLIMYLLTLLVEDLVRLPYLRTSGRTEEFTLTRPCIKIEKKKC